MRCIAALVLNVLFPVVPVTAAGKPGGSLASADRRPVLLELFTSEGCSSCPPADKLLAAFDRSQPVPGADLIVLSEHVDYWNHGGWADPFSAPAFSVRQQDYADKLGLDAVYTPQLIVDGTTELVGSNAAGARNAITKALRQNKIPVALSNLTRQGDHVSLHVEVGALPPESKSAIVYLAVADDEDHSPVTHGENAGRFLTHVAVVRALTPLGKPGPSGFKKDVTLPVKAAGQNGLRVVAFVQEGKSRQVLGAAQRKL